MGLRRRVTIGFMGIVSILLISGMVSFVELSLLSRETDKIFETTRRNSDYAGEMLDALRSQNYAFVEMLAFDRGELDSACFNAINRFEDVLTRARKETFSPEYVDSMLVTSTSLRDICNQFVTTRDSLARLTEARKVVLQSVNVSRDSLALIPIVESEIIEKERMLEQSVGLSTVEIYDLYNSTYDHVVKMVGEYLTLSQEVLAPDAQLLHHNAYRAVTPVLISLLVMIVVLLMLYYFTMITCVNPIVEINKSLKNFISFKVPFAPKYYKRDEADEVCSRIETLIKMNKKAVSEVSKVSDEKIK